MSLTAAMIGTTTEPIVHDVDSRWLMAYPAGFASPDPCYLDTRRDGGIEAHPLFPVCLEWPAVLALGDRLKAAGLTRDESARSVHYTHDLVIHRAVRPGDRTRTTATLASIEPHRSGTLAILRLETVDDRGEPIASTAMGSLYRDATPRPGADAGAGADGGTEASPEPAPDPVHAQRVTVAAGAAHVYTECSRIWNPIHTDPRTAARAGLPGIILHGTATLAMAVSEVVRHDADGQPGRVRRIEARFVGMVPMPSEIEIRIFPATGRTGDGTEDGGARSVPFDVQGPTGRRVLREGTVRLGDS